VGGRRRGRCGKDCVPNPFDILQDFIVPETEDAVAAFYEPSIAFSVAAIFRVLATIDLDHQPLFATNKIHDIGSNGFLTHEFKPGK
jgi:hypothetical protein